MPLRCISHVIFSEKLISNLMPNELAVKIYLRMDSHFIDGGEKPIRIQEQSPYESLDPDSAQSINNIRHQWIAWKQSSPVKNQLDIFFRNSKNPYESSLKMMVNSGDFYSSKKNSLACFVMEYFSTWKKSNRGMLPSLTQQLKIDAFKTVTKQKNQLLINSVLDVFEMKANKHKFLGQIHALIQRKMYPEACRIVIHLGLHDAFGVEEFIIPLIFQNKFIIVKDFLDGSKRHQLKTANYIDRIVEEKDNTVAVEKIIKKLEISDANMQDLTPKSLSKLLERIMKLYNIPLEKCPCFQRRRGWGALSFLIKKRFLKKNIGIESWSEMVEEIVGNNGAMQLKLIQKIVGYGEIAEAKRWADKFKIPYERRPFPVQAYREDSLEVKESSGNGGIIDEAPAVSYHQMALAESQIHLIDSVIEFENFVQSHLRNLSVCGMDCEWKPEMGFQSCNLALIQIATFEAVYIIDIHTLLPLLKNHQLKCFHDGLFLNDGLLKIGFDFTEDFSMIQKTRLKFGDLRPVGSGYLDLLPLWRVLVENYKFEFPFTEDLESSSGPVGLAKLVKLTMGKELDKSEQFSNWERRPLRKSQLVYAALDAYCLLEVYGVLQKETERQNVPFFEAVSVVGREKGKKKMGKKK